MARYQLTTQDRSKGGKSTAAKQPPNGYKSFMQYVGTLGLQAIAVRYCDGDVKQAGKCLSRLGLWATDPAPWNHAWQLKDVPEALILRACQGVAYKPTDEIPF